MRRGAPKSPDGGARAAADPLLGRVVAGKYRVEALIGVGGRGAVNRATQLAVQRPVALKVLRAVAGVSEQQLADRFRREAMATSQLHHPNTVQVIDFGEDDGVLYMVLELLEGAPLSRVIQREAPLPPERAAAIGKQIAKALAEAHAHGIVHRDLKPDNVFICAWRGDPDFVKVMDFGIARIMTADVSMTRTGMMIGTPKYMAPEQAMAKKVGPAADLYALGVILFEMLTGEAPFSGDSHMALALAQINQAPPPLELRGQPARLESAWRELVSALLVKSPDKRASDAEQVAAWLGRIEAEARQTTGAGVAAGGTGARRASEVRLPTRPRLMGDDGAAARTVQARASPARARGGEWGRGWVWVAAVVFMLLGGLVAVLLVKP